MTLPDPEASRAILIGTAHYAPDSGFESFPEVERSLRGFAEFLGGETGLPEKHIDVVLDPPDNQTIAARVTAAAEAATGLLLVYYVGHGVAVDNQLHLTHTGSRAADADVTALPYPVLRSRIKTNARGPVVVILDCCHSGRAFGRDVLAGDGEPLREATDIDGAFVLTATDEKTKFARARGDGGRTAFTGMMLDTLRTGVPTADRHLTMTVLFRELRNRLPAANMPRPKALERGTAGRIALAANAGWTGRTESAALPIAGDTPYTATIRDLTPADGLLDRETELAELANFCDGDEPYIWWQAGPWAGKTALMTWFALNPPPHVRVVSFFITSRMAAQDDHTAFTDALLEQLSALLPDQAAAVGSPTANRDALRRHLLDLAAQRAADSGGRLVLLVDGLDEDRGQPSIASLLPKRPGPGLRVIVSGRPNPALPIDVPGSHPLHQCRRREVDRSTAAFGIIQAARLELRGIIDRSDTDQEVLGLITAAHGLTGSELEDLTGLPPFRINSILSGVTGRTFRSRSSRFAPDQINLLAHETLQDEAEQALGRGLLDAHRKRIHEWASAYRDRGWPGDTPTYLLTRYFSMLRGQRDLTRMRDMAMDTARHDRLLLLTGSDGMARTEIATATEYWLDQQDPELLVVCELAMRRYRLGQRGRTIPEELPAALARMGEIVRANSLADGMLHPARRLRARIGVVAARMHADDFSYNRALIGGLRRSDTPELGDPDLCRLVASLVGVGDIGGAEEIADEVTTPQGRIAVLAHLVPAWQAAGRHATVEAALTEINRHVLLTGGPERDEVVRHAIRVSAAIGDIKHADKLRGTADSVELRVVALGAIARALAAQGHPDSAGNHVRSALSAVQQVVGLVARSNLLASIAADLVAAGFGDELRNEVDDIEAGLAEYPPSGAQAAVVHLVTCLIELGEVDSAVALGRRFTEGTQQLAVMADMLTPLLNADRTADARQLATEIELRSYQRTDVRERDFAFFFMVRALGTAGDITRALEVAGRIHGLDAQFLAFSYLAIHAAGTAGHAEILLQLAVETVHAMFASPDAEESGGLWNFVGAVFSTTWLGDEIVSESRTPLAALTRHLLARGADDVAHGLADQLATVYSSAMRPLDGLAEGLGGLAAVFVEAGDTEVVRGLFTRMNRLAGRLTVLRSIVEEAGVDRARPIVTPLLDEIDRKMAVDGPMHTLPNRVNRALLAAALADGETVARFASAPGPAGNGTQYVMSALAVAHARAGSVNEAMAIAEGLSDDFARSVAGRELVAALASSGNDPTAALLYAERIPLVDERIRAIAAVVPVLAENLGAEQAASIWSETVVMHGEISRADARDRSITVLVEAALKIGLVDQALELARTTEVDARRELLTQIVDVLVTRLAEVPDAAQASVRRRIRRILAEIWGFAPWFAALNTVARFDPELLSGIADAAMRLDSQSHMANQMNAI
ncbi:caspase, EACC1-associated type [Nocardia tengchongensis]